MSESAGWSDWVTSVLYNHPPFSSTLSDLAHFLFVYSKFGECVDFIQKTKNNMQNKYRPGVFVGIKLESGELIVAEKGGFYELNDYLRVPQEH